MKFSGAAFSSSLRARYDTAAPYSAAGTSGTYSRGAPTSAPTTRCSRGAMPASISSSVPASTPRARASVCAAASEKTLWLATPIRSRSTAPGRRQRSRAERNEASVSSFDPSTGDGHPRSSAVTSSMARLAPLTRRTLMGRPPAAALRLAKASSSASTRSDSRR